MSKNIIINNAKEDIDLYANDFQSFFEQTKQYYFQDEEVLFQCYLKTLIFKNWKEGLNHLNINSLDNLFDEIHNDINSSFYLSTFGLYRTAKMHLRSGVELSLQLIYFFDHNVEFKQWEEGDFVIKHNILSEYIKKHPHLKETQNKEVLNELMIKITSKWKHFSKHIHAESLSYFQTESSSSSTNTFIIGDFNIWKKDFIETIDLLNTLLSYFFSKQLVKFPTNIKKILNGNF